MTRLSGVSLAHIATLLLWLLGTALGCSASSSATGSSANDGGSGALGMSAGGTGGGGTGGMAGAGVAGASSAGAGGTAGSSGGSGGAAGAGGHTSMGGASGGGGTGGVGGDAADDAGTNGTSGGGSTAANVWADSAAAVEIFVNGAALGKSTAAGAVVNAQAALIVGAENIIVLRATKGSASNPFAHAELSGAFGKLGTERMWKVKAAAGSEVTEATGSWATLSYDDSAWANATNAGVAVSSPFPSGAHVEGVWTSNKSDSTVLLRAKVYLPRDYAPGTPKGFASATTGGGNVSAIKVTTPAELTAAVASNAAKVIQIAGSIDYTGTEGTVTGNCCLYTSQCATGASEYSIDTVAGCTSRGKTSFTCTYDKAGRTPLDVGSNTTIIGVGASASVKGKGLRFHGGVRNIIVRNLTITNINPQFVWGGDGLTIDDASNVWIDHNHVSLVGRMMLVTGFGQASNVTVSWNEFDGVTPYSSYCNGTHYWLWLLLGSNDTITLEDNWIHDTGGRGPHAGGLLNAQVLGHLLNNFYNFVPGHALDAESNNYTSNGAAYSDLGRLFAEGNYFDRVTMPVQIATVDGKGFGPGQTFAPIASNLSSSESACLSGVGRGCVANVAVPQNGTWPLDTGVTMAMAKHAGMPTPYPAVEVPLAVPHLAGTGHL